MVEFITKLKRDGSVERVPVGESANTAVALPAIDDIDAIKRECMESLLMILAANKGDIRALGVIKELLDRIQGKAVTPIAAQVLNVTQEKQVDRQQLAREIRFMLELAERRGG